MIGEIRWVLTPFYNQAMQKMAFKRRPALLIAQADAQDYIVLPVSRVTRRENLHPIYDIEINPSLHPTLNLPVVSYVRTHKQTVIHAAEIDGFIVDLKKDFPDLYLSILAQRELFSLDISQQALF